MKRAQLFLKCGLSVLAQLEKDECLIGGFDFTLPAIDRFHTGQNIRARSKFFCDQLIRNFSRRFGIWKRAECEQNFLRHKRNSTEDNEANKDCLQKQEQTSLS